MIRRRPLGGRKKTPSTPQLERGQSRPPCRQAGPPTKTRTNRPRRVRKRPRRCLSRARVRAGREPLEVCKGQNRLQGRTSDRLCFEWPPEARKEHRTARKPPTHPQPSPSRKTRQKPGNRPANYRRTRGDSGLATVASWPGLNLSPKPRRPDMYFGSRLVFCSM